MTFKLKGSQLSHHQCDIILISSLISASNPLKKISCAEAPKHDHLLFDVNNGWGGERVCSQGMLFPKLKVRQNASGRIDDWSMKCSASK